MVGADRWDGEQGRRSVRGRVRTLRRMHAVGWSPGSEKRKNRPTLVGDTLTRFCLAGCADFTVSFSFTFTFTFRQRNQCKRERWDRILAQVTFSTKFRAPPLSASLSAGERGGYHTSTQTLGKPLVTFARATARKDAHSMHKAARPLTDLACAHPGHAELPPRSNRAHR